MKLIPITKHEANAFIAAHHRHNKPVQGLRFALGAIHEGELVGVAVVGRPGSRMLDQRQVAEVTRLCVRPDAPRNACSFLYGAARRAWQAMGGVKLITYTLQIEPGDSLRGAGAVVEAKLPGRTRSGWANRPGREIQAIQAQAKLRWAV